MHNAYENVVDIMKNNKELVAMKISPSLSPVTTKMLPRVEMNYLE
jgi:hypothetical protein